MLALVPFLGDIHGWMSWQRVSWVLETNYITIHIDITVHTLPYITVHYLTYVLVNSLGSSLQLPCK